MSRTLAVILILCLFGCEFVDEKTEEPTSSVSRQVFCRKLIKVQIENETLVDGEEEEQNEHVDKKRKKLVKEKDYEEKILDITYKLSETTTHDQTMECSISDGSRVYTQYNYVHGSVSIYGNAPCSLIYDINNYSFGEFILTYTAGMGYINYSDQEDDISLDFRFSYRDCTQMWQ